MLAKYGEIYNFDDSTEIFFIFLSNVSQYWYLDESLRNYLWALFHNLQSQKLSIFVVKNLEDFSKRSFVDWIHNLVTIGNMVTNFIFIKVTTF